MKFIVLLFAFLTFSVSATEYMNFETSRGNFSINLYGDNLLLAANFKNFVANRVYEGTVFSYNVKGEWVTLGDLKTKKKNNQLENMRGASAVYTAVSPLVKNGNRTHKRGTVTLVKQYYDTQEVTAAFMVTLRDLPDFDSQYQIIGEVVSGLDVIDDISRMSVSNQFAPLEDIELLNTFVSNKPIVEKNLTPKDARVNTIQELVQSYKSESIIIMILFFIHFTYTVLTFMRDKKVNAISALGFLVWGYFLYLVFSNTNSDLSKVSSIAFLMLAFIVLNKAKMIKNEEDS